MSSQKSFAAFVDVLALATNALRAYIRQQLKECSLDLTSEMMQVMHYLWANDGVNQQEIANAVNKDKASLTSLLDNLVRRELVERRADSQDRRNKRVVLTTKGRDLERQISPLMQEMYELAGQALPEDQLHASMAVLEQITKNLTQAKH